MNRTEHRVPLRDGTLLATDLYLPDGPGPFPVIMERTPYGKREVSRSERSAANATPARRGEVAETFTQAGYAVVYQDVRGRHASEGTFVKYLSDAEDGFDTMAWVMAQPWCNGRIGTMGLSYAAHTQAALGCLNPPGLAAQVLDSGGFADSYQGGIRYGGAFELKQATWAYTQALLAPETKADPLREAALKAEDIRGWFARFPWKPGHSPIRHAPDYEAYLFEQWREGAFGPFWEKLGIYAKGYHHQYANVPMVHMSSWYDPYPRTATDNFTGLKAHGKGPQFLILGPWTHGNRSVTWSGGVDFGEAATIDSWCGDWRSFRLRFFDRFLRGIENGVEKDAPVRLFVMGGGSGRKNAEGRMEHGGQWREEADWPLPGTRFTPFYLHTDGSLSAQKPAESAPPLSYDYDPKNPTPSIGGSITSGEPIMVGGGFDQVEGPDFFGCHPPYIPMAARADVLAFQTAPLEEDVEITGPIEVKLWVATDGPDTDFTAKLVDVYPPNADYPHGYALNITDGIIRCRYRNDWSNPEPMVPDEPTEITVTLFPTSNLFKAGHRIRIDIASANFPHYDQNPNTGEPDGNWRRSRVARNTVFLDASRPSHALLPVIPARR
ncbi:CocE/NonD family hydrolase [Acetobacteraceae bacterium H6797]|nr:CocE/NonD family hydrolase [Acetobacteraceae bacterium H6797]